MERRSAMLSYLSHLPRKMLSLHDHDAIAALVLHDLCSERCFNLNKAVYLVDNPDFNCIRGVAGFCQLEADHGSQDIWTNPSSFSQYMSQSDFNQKVRAFACESHKKSNAEDHHLAERIAKELEFKDYDFYTIGMKHDNHGFFICERGKDHDDMIRNMMHDSLYLLGFCPIH